MDSKDLGTTTVPGGGVPTTNRVAVIAIAPPARGGLRQDGSRAAALQDRAGTGTIRLCCRFLSAGAAGRGFRFCAGRRFPGRLLLGAVGGKGRSGVLELFELRGELDRVGVVRIVCLSGDLVEETAGDGGAVLAPLLPAQGQREREPPLGPRDSPVAQPPFVSAAGSRERRCGRTPSSMPTI